MAVTSSAPISITDLVTEFGGSAPHSLTEYYRGGSLVPSGPAANNSIPTSGAISLTNFFGAVKETSTDNYTLTTGIGFYGLGLTAYGFNSLDFSNYGSITPATIEFTGFNVTVRSVSVAGTLRFRVSGTVGNSGWTSMTVGGVTYNRTDATYAIISGGGFNGTQWSWANDGGVPTTNGATAVVTWIQ